VRTQSSEAGNATRIPRAPQFRALETPLDSTTAFLAGSPSVSGRRTNVLKSHPTPKSSLSPKGSRHKTAIREIKGTTAKRENPDRAVR